MGNLTVPRARKLVVAMKKETNYGVDAFSGTITAGDILPAMEINPAINIEEIENLALSGDIGRLPSGIGAEVGGVTFSSYLRGRDDEFVQDTKMVELHTALAACGLEGTVSGTTPNKILTYIPTSSPDSHTIYVVHENGTALKLVGCFGDLELTMRSGAIAIARFAFQGMLAGEADITYVSANMNRTPKYPQMKSVNFLIGTTTPATYAPRIAAVGFRMGNVLTRVPSINASSGVAGFLISDRRPLLTIDPEAASLATFPWYTDHAAGTLMKCDFTLGGSTAYNRIKPTFSAALGNGLQIVSRTWSQRDGLIAFPTTLLATIANGNDDFALIFS